MSTPAPQCPESMGRAAALGSQEGWEKESPGVSGEGDEGKQLAKGEEGGMLVTLKAHGGGGEVNTRIFRACNTQ